jgi:predicted amidohydrolase
MSDEFLLLEALKRAEGRADRWIVALWTWLEPRVGDLSDRDEKLHAIRDRETLLHPAMPDFGAALTRLRGSEDMLGDAAAQLVTLDHWLAGSGRLETITGEGPLKGIDGECYLVGPLRMWLAEAFWEGDKRHSRHFPPAIDYSPSMQILASHLTVVPLIAEKIELRDVAPPVRDVAASVGVELARQRFEAITGRDKRGGGWEEEQDEERGGGPDEEQDEEFGEKRRKKLVIHLATLGPNSLDGLERVPERKVFRYLDPCKEETTTAIEQGLTDAIATACRRRATILVLPELAVPVRCLPRLQQLLADAHPAPALTVAGLRHDDVVNRGETTHDEYGKRLSRWANEAVVLGEDGSELFRQRKLTAYGFLDDELRLEEDTRKCKHLMILRTAIGNIAVVVCLDAFAAPKRRLAASYASVVLVPSLSASVGAHRPALTDLAREVGGAALVCNRDPVAEGREAWKPHKVRSFWTIALLNKSRVAHPLGKTKPTLVFDLTAERERERARNRAAGKQGSTA